LLTTTSPRGASKGKSKWRADYNPFFAGFDVVILPDNDAAGRAHAEHVANNLAPIASAVRVLYLPDLPDKGDISDWMPHHSPEEFEALVEQTPPWTAQPPPAELDPIAELNQTYAVIRVENRVAILNEHLDADGLPTFSLLSPDNFKLWLANRKIEITIGEETERLPLAPLWIESPQRREFDGIAFAPQGAPRGYYNLWKGLAIEPNSNGSCQKFKEHLRYNVCDDNAALYNWVFGWFADIFQNPTFKKGTSLVLRGEQGVGKTIVGETFGQLLGLHYCQVADPRYVTGRFNAHLSTACCCIVTKHSGPAIAPLRASSKIFPPASATRSNSRDMKSFSSRTMFGCSSTATPAGSSPPAWASAALLPSTLPITKKRIQPISKLSSTS
jgi:hypothetical protein